MFSLIFPENVDEASSLSGSPKSCDRQGFCLSYNAWLLMPVGPAKIDPWVLKRLCLFPVSKKRATVLMRGHAKVTETTVSGEEILA